VGGWGGGGVGGWGVGGCVGRSPLPNLIIVDTISALEGKRGKRLLRHRRGKTLSILGDFKGGFALCTGSSEKEREKRGRVLVF